MVGSGLNALVDAVDKILLMVRQPLQQQQLILGIVTTILVCPFCSTQMDGVAAQGEDEEDEEEEEPTREEQQSSGPQEDAKQKSITGASATPSGTPIKALRKSGSSNTASSSRAKQATTPQAKQQQTTPQAKQQRTSKQPKQQTQVDESQVAQLRALEEQLNLAQEETAAVRQKLRSAVNKGKGIERERNQLLEEVGAHAEYKRDNQLRSDTISTHIVLPYAHLCHL